MIKQRYKNSILIFASLSIGLTAGDFAPVGTTVAQFLEIGAGARANGLGSAYTAVTDDAGAVFWNPAGLADVKAPSLFLTNNNWPADINVGGLSIAGKIGRVGSFAISVISLMTNEMEITTIQDYDGTGEYFDISNNAFGLTFARYLTDRVSVGVTGKFVSEDYFNHGYSTWALDLGTMYRTDFHGLKIGMSILHFGPEVGFSGKYVDYSNQDSYVNLADDTDDVPFEFEQYSLPVNFRVGISMRAFQRGSHTLMVSSDMVHPNNNLEQYNFGLEYNLHDAIFLRSGYRIGVDEGGISLGGGAKLDLAGWSQIAINYSYSDLGILTNSHRIGLLLSL